MTEERDKPTALMQRDELLPLVQATALTMSSPHTVPRVLVDRQLRSPGVADDADRISVWLVLVFVGILIGMFIAIVASA